ncbi:MAG TPA: efflux RND transporter periplasmic adaptor subunit [Haliangiales bacterium]|nr:efflux RND transporter periplasmic adaptor subunit [Haliangiales bacterium]
MTDTRHPHDSPPRGVKAAAILRWLLVAAMAAAALASVAYYFGWFARSTSAPATAATTYICPMHPSVKQDHPGECPICSMTLVPSTSTPAPATSTVPGLAPVDLPPERIQVTGMRTARVARERLGAEIRAVGAVVPNERGLAEIQTRVAGWIQTLVVNQTGERVARGQVVATLYSPDLLTAQQELLNALRWDQEGAGEAHAATRGLPEDARARLELLGIAPRDIDDIERTRKPAREIKLRSPVAGHVIQKNVVAGAYVQPGTPLLSIADLSTVWVVADVYEYEVARIRPGLAATLVLAAFPGERLPGKVTFVSPTVDPATRTLKVRAELPNRDLRLRPGMYGDVYLATDDIDALVVPREALVDTGELQYVFVARDGGRFEPRRVRVGARAADKVQIVDGVAEGELVVTTANFLLDSESRLRAAVRGDGATPAPASRCDAQFDAAKYPDKLAQCRSCEIQHRGMGQMEDDCIAAIPKPWK